MHIPENYLSPSTCAVMAAAVVPVWTVAVKKVKLEVSKEKMPLLGVGAALSFLGMMFNVPLLGGTTGHIVGGTMIAMLLGPYAACISVTIALLLQAVLFGDGGILSFGANCFNMAFILPFTGYYIAQFIGKRTKTRKGRNIGIAVGAYAGLNLAALCAAIEFGIQPLLFTDANGLALYCPYPLSVSIPAMMASHLLIVGFLEAAISVAVVEFVERTSPDSVYNKKSKKPLLGLLAGLIVLTPIGLFAAGTAWGEWGADEISEVVSGGEALGYTPGGLANGFSFEALFPDYTMGAFPEWTAYILSAIAGVAILVILFKLISSCMKQKVNYN